MSIWKALFQLSSGIQYFSPHRASFGIFAFCSEHFVHSLPEIVTLWLMHAYIQSHFILTDTSHCCSQSPLVTGPLKGIYLFLLSCKYISSTLPPSLKIFYLLVWLAHVLESVYEKRFLFFLRLDNFAYHNDLHSPVKYYNINLYVGMYLLSIGVM